MGKIILLVAMASMLGGCTKTIDSYCLKSEPIYLTRQDMGGISPETLRMIVSHNEVWEKSCRGLELTR